MAIKELPVFPQTTWSEGQGMVGLRKWVLDAGDNIDYFVRIVSQSHWPNRPDCIPVQIQTGPYWEGVNIRRPEGDDGVRTYENMGVLPEYGAYLVVAHYAMHKMLNCWPARYRKPWHPPGTTLSLNVRGSGQFLLVSPAGLRNYSPLVDCNNSIGAALHASVGTRIIVPVTEFHLTCDLMTKRQVDIAMGSAFDAPSETRAWDRYQGSVNKTGFLGAPPNTLLFDGYSLQETYACDSITPHRYRLTACLKRRVILKEDGGLKYSGGLPVGWNHDFVNKPTNERRWDWHLVKIWSGAGCEERYKLVDFNYLFGDNLAVACDDLCDQASGLTELADCDVTCQPEICQPPSSDSYELPSDSGAESSEVTPSSSSSSSSELPVCCE